jgi:FAD binding domain
MRWHLVPIVSCMVLVCGAHDPTRKTAPANTPVPTVPKTNAPAHCKKLPTDADWPLPEIWKAELKGVDVLMPEELKHPQYVYEAKTVQHIQNAVKFAAKYNIRLSIINSGHDFLGRNDAPSGLLLPVSGLKGIRLLEEYIPTTKGAEPVNYKTPTNTIQLKPSKQAAATIGGGITGTDLLNVLTRIGMTALTAAHRMLPCLRL